MIVVGFIFQAWSVPEVLRPLYESSRVVAQKMTTVVRAFFFWPYGLFSLQLLIFLIRSPIIGFYLFMNEKVCFICSI